MSKPIPALRHHLVALLGRTPQVLTETLYALCVQAGIPISEVSAISTQEGRQIARDKLFDKKDGRFYRLQRDYPAQCRQLRFSPKQIFVAHDGLLPLQYPLGEPICLLSIWIRTVRRIEQEKRWNNGTEKTRMHKRCSPSSRGF